MRIIARFEKGEAVRFVSHLDIQRAFQRAFRRAGVPLAYSQGFNPHPQLSFATALAVGYTSSAEWFDVKLERDMDAGEFMESVNAALPAGFRILEAQLAPDSMPALTALMSAARYRLSVTLEDGVSGERLAAEFAAMAGEPIIVEKRTKGGMRNVDIRPLLLDYSFGASDGEKCALSILGAINASGSLNIDLLLGALSRRVGTALTYRAHRDVIYSEGGTAMPKLPAENE